MQERKESIKDGEERRKVWVKYEKEGKRGIGLQTFISTKLNLNVLRMEEARSVSVADGGKTAAVHAWLGYPRNDLELLRNSSQITRVYPKFFRTES
jgi:hypothetical protein